MHHGHLIPAMDAALQLAAHATLASIVVTPTYAARLRPAVESSGLPVRLMELPLDLAGTDDVGQIPLDEEAAYLLAASRLRDLLERHLRAHAPPATCIVSDICHPWTAGLAAGLGVPRLSFLECHGRRREGPRRLPQRDHPRSCRPYSSLTPASSIIFFSFTKRPISCADDTPLKARQSEHICYWR
ncbi:UDP-glycosyltransferase 73E1-like [Hordeum vulgare subsp. vulgare]|uniref:Glycosyltransferase n=1 Tax=Hordeum vulgare subsp. vulgare TaxID=112509 RepID=M0ZDZ4_HORVV|nr:UDP-glycosyltransferase 73E1-like [Hordeum vulgare subsp. vulgare]XP_044957030.1 UDP-glycosyltransferase 73E1-like [Hordeum vulgare subsp. vulgare]XP_044957031.1 UDP-glycosyltransferase 73E1-like [Hordeum vulgare subsp. vulgare]XP_044957032.1 UDP-glycosyltransferase 73E1-like [Hordeum vulgare subsp. vulgare]XP_044957033.1 UDP-glycosyltransferase 73E1-like [Hordeum vulgare subsp. vulgare]